MGAKQRFALVGFTGPQLNAVPAHGSRFRGMTDFPALSGLEGVWSPLAAQDAGQLFQGPSVRLSTAADYGGDSIGAEAGVEGSPARALSKCCEPFHHKVRKGVIRRIVVGCP